MSEPSSHLSASEEGIRPPSEVSLRHFLKTGLTSQEAQKRLEKFGPNELKRKKNKVVIFK